MRGLLSKGWQFNAIDTDQSGLDFTVSNAASIANTGGGDRPDQIASASLPPSQRIVTHWFNTAAFVTQPPYTLGYVGRNTLFAPGLTNLDFSVFKEFPVKKHYCVQFRAEIFNITNTPNFGIPTATRGCAYQKLRPDRNH